MQPPLIFNKIIGIKSPYIFKTKHKHNFSISHTSLAWTPYPLMVGSSPVQCSNTNFSAAIVSSRDLGAFYPSRSLRYYASMTTYNRFCSITGLKFSSVVANSHRLFQGINYLPSTYLLYSITQYVYSSNPIQNALIQTQEELEHKGDSLNFKSIHLWWMT